MGEERAAKRIKSHDGASSSSSADPGSTYEVFLSFRGVDTRLNFTDHLYSYLRDVGFETFRDNEKLHVGEKIGPDLMKAIEESRISIPIFSKGYASSKWCLRELTHMVKCMNDIDPEGRRRHTVCPIFYDVTPNDVKHHQTGSFAKAFVKHANDKKLDACTVQEWKDALKEVGQLKGWEKDKIADGHEAEFIREIVTKVCKMLKKRHVSLTDALVGMDHHIEEMTKLLDSGGNDVRIVGIVGMGGIGKTTIAKFMYNQLCDKFQPHCTFLEDVRERVERNGFAELREQLTANVLQRTVDGFTIEKNAFNDKKVLIVLDDVHDKSQLREIFGGRDSQLVIRKYFGSGSRIIVTTRNKDVFVKEEGDLIYEPGEMNYDDSLLLFCEYAFKSTQPEEGFEDISREFVQTAAGLPLSLIVLGSMLYPKKKEYWEDTLEKLKETPAENVQKRLKISYDDLDHKQKQIFLDIACHFIGKDKTCPLYMWKDLKLNPENGIDALISLSLITIRDDNVLRMHDQLRDMGRNIVYEENSNDPGQRSRLWSQEDVLEVLRHKLGTRKVQTLSVNYDSEDDSIILTDGFGLSMLRYLCLVGPRMEGNFDGLVSNLRWFRWCFHSRKSIMTITNFRTDKLVILDLSESDISDGWESFIQIKEATNLKVLNLSGCRYLTKLPEQDIGNLTNLIKLLLSRSMIKSLPDAIGKLKKLEVLDCSFCESLEGQLPERIGRLSSLRVLNLFRTQVDKLPEKVGGLCNLKKLYLSGTHIKKLPEMGIENLKNLEELNCSHCPCLEGQLPEGIWGLSSLRVLNLSFTKADRSLKKDVRRLCNSRNLDLSDSDIKKMGVSIEMLHKLEELNYYPWPLKRELTDAIESLSVLDKIADSSTQERPNLEMTRNLEDMKTSSTAPGSTYEVFLSFTGADIRLSFADHLYNYLSDVGVRAFRDNEKLRVGEEIGPDLMKSQHQQKAMEESKISIPIFSKGYAFSEWCLMELTHMVKCMNSDHRHTIWPILYDVTPWDVRCQTGSFAEAFLQHTKKFDEPIVQEWKDALKEVFRMRGWEKRIADGYEGQLVYEIVRDVCMKLKKGNVPLTGDLVGMDHHREEMTKLLDIDSSNDARIVGIVGMGGIGKTTIAKFMYNQLCDHFQHQCCFFEDVRQTVKHNNGCNELQQKLISDMVKSSAGKKFLNIRNAFICKKVLIVLDDVKNRTQLREIIGSLEYFGSGSRIIVTTRNKDVFIDSEGDLIYEPKEMKFEDSLLLFCKHAFRSTRPGEGFGEISKEVAQTAAGLPSSIVAIGSMLFSKERKEDSEATLKMFKVMPLYKVGNRLKISYDTLNPNQQQIFLDIACHFIGKDKTHAIHMWNYCGFFPKSCEGIDALISLSLITIKDDNVLRMHDQLRDLGRNIVYRENPSDPGKRSRLWSQEDVLEVLRSQSGTHRVETLSVNYRWDSDCIFSNDDFRGLSSLRYLSLEGPTLKGDFKGLFSHLMWFKCRILNHLGKMPITNFCPRKLVVLDISESDISDGWESFIQIKTTTMLKVLKLSGCRHLTKLPECLWNMKSLVELDLSHTEITELSETGIGNLTNLTKIILMHSMIKKLPDAIGKLEKLEVLDCSNCSSFEGQLPEVIGRLSSLRILNLFNTKVDRLPEAVRRLSPIRDLNLESLTDKEDVGNSLNLREPNLHDNSTKKLQKREEFDYVSLEGQLPKGIWRLSSLRYLNLSYTKITGGILKDISGLPDLENLDLGHCEKLQFPVEGLKLPLSLTKLVIPLTEASLNGIRSLVNLRDLEFYKNVGYCCEPVAEDEDVVVDHHHNNNGIPIIDMSKLEYLTLRELDDHVMSCRLLQAMKFDSSSRLNYLRISSCRFETLRTSSLDLSDCQMLNKLEIERCQNTREIKGLEVLTSLDNISISRCDSLEVLLLSNLSSLKRLKTLVIGRCPKLHVIKGLEVLTSLEELRVDECPLLKKEKLHPDLLKSGRLKIK